MADRFVTQERNGRWLVVDTEATKKKVRSSHATKDVAQKYVDRYNALHRERIQQIARKLRHGQSVD